LGQFHRVRLAIDREKFRSRARRVMRTRAAGSALEDAIAVGVKRGAHLGHEGSPSRTAASRMLGEVGRARRG